jgi:hypothetical protein
VLLVLLRRPVLSAYLILTVVFGYLTALGLTYLLFDALETGPFPGLDWKVPFFLFTILVAGEEDYNILLLTRVREEEREHGPTAGVTAAIGKTGVITNCGLIMAGTFASLFAESLSEMWRWALRCPAASSSTRSLSGRCWCRRFCSSSPGGAPVRRTDANTSGTPNRDSARAKPRSNPRRSAAQIKDHPLHPVLVAFPIAFGVAALLTDLAGLLDD